MKLKLSPDVLALNPGVGKAVQVERDAQQARVPRAPAAERDGLTSLLVRGWSPETSAGGRLHRLREIWGERRETGWHGDLSLACAEAKEMEER